MENQNNNAPQPQIIVTQSPKSMGIALILALLLGPLGLLYATVKGGIIMIVASAVFAFFTLGISLFITQSICVLWAYFAVKKYNESLLGHASY